MEPRYVDEVTRKRLERRLGPDAIRRNLIRASLFLVAFELLEIEVDRPGAGALSSCRPLVPSGRQLLPTRPREAYQLAG